jgi:Helix-turn-helix domain
MIVFNKEKKYVNEHDAAAYLTLKPQSLRAMRCQSKGPAFLKLGRRVLYRLCDLDAYVEKHAVMPQLTE